MSWTHTDFPATCASSLETATWRHSRSSPTPQFNTLIAGSLPCCCDIEHGELSMVAGQVDTPPETMTMTSIVEELILRFTQSRLRASTARCEINCFVFCKKQTLPTVGECSPEALKAFSLIGQQEHILCQFHIFKVCP